MHTVLYYDHTGDVDLARILFAIKRSDKTGDAKLNITSGLTRDHIQKFAKNFEVNKYPPKKVLILKL